MKKPGGHLAEHHACVEETVIKIDGWLLLWPRLCAGHRRVSRRWTGCAMGARCFVQWGNTINMLAWARRQERLIAVATDKPRNTDTSTSVFLDIHYPKKVHGRRPEAFRLGTASSAPFVLQQQLIAWTGSLHVQRGSLGERVRKRNSRQTWAVLLSPLPIG